MKVLMIEPDYAPYEMELNELHEMQAAVGGRIAAIYPFEERVAVVYNDERIINRLSFNRSVPGGYGGVFGPFFVCGLGPEEFCSLSPEQVERYKKQFHSAEILLEVKGNEVITMKVPPREKGRPPKEKGRDAPPGRE